MDHVAIMRKSWGLLPKILSGEKTIESRWYMAKYVPWGRIKKHDTIYFKNSGESVTVKTSVSGVVQFEDLNPKRVMAILNKYGRRDGLGINDIQKYYKLFKNKKYCILVFLKNPKKVKPFNINKTGFGTMSAWITVKNIKTIISS